MHVWADHKLSKPVPACTWAENDQEECISHCIQTEAKHRLKKKCFCCLFPVCWFIGEIYSCWELGQDLKHRIASLCHDPWMLQLCSSNATTKQCRLCEKDFQLIVSGSSIPLSSPANVNPEQMRPHNCLTFLQEDRELLSTHQIYCCVQLPVQLSGWLSNNGDVWQNIYATSNNVIQANYRCVQGCMSLKDPKTQLLRLNSDVFPNISLTIFPLPLNLNKWNTSQLLFIQPHHWIFAHLPIGNQHAALDVKTEHFLWSVQQQGSPL